MSGQTENWFRMCNLPVPGGCGNRECDALRRYCAAPRLALFSMTYTKAHTQQ